MVDGVVSGFEEEILDKTKTASFQNGLHIASFFDGAQDLIKVLDYGAGGDPGDTGLALIHKGFDVTSFEPHFAENAS